MPGRLRIAFRLLILLLILGGILSGALGLFAFSLGLDNDPGWGKGRITLAAAGAAMLVCAACLLQRAWLRQRSQAISSSPLTARMSADLRHISSGIQSSRPYLRTKRILSNLWQRLTGSAPLGWLRRIFTGSSRRYALLAAGITLLVYIWYMTAGTWTTWTPYSRYFDRQANAFLSGQLALLEEPSAELKALPNPYDWRARENVPHLWDASFYKGRYYLYWGPAPAMLAALVKAVVPVTIEDQYLLLFFCGGLAVLFGLLLALVHDRLYRDLPAWTVFFLTLLAGLAVPMLWLINSPHVYATAIAGGQFFLVAGLYCALRAYLREPPPPRGWLAAAGLAWGAAVACRLNLVLAVAFFFAVILWEIARRRSWQAALHRLIILGLPLLLWAAGLAWYNLARFDSIFETGHRYQLTGLALPEDYQLVTSADYIVPSLYSYLVRPLAISLNDFPFVFAPFIKESMWPSFIQPPPYYYYSEQLAGIIAVMPAVWLGLLPVLGLVGWFWRWLQEQPVSFRPKFSTAGEGLVWTVSIGGMACLLAPLLVFISSSMRYLADFTPMAVLLAAQGFWWGLRRKWRLPAVARLLPLAAILLILLSITISLLVNFGNGDKRFENNNPALYYTIAGLFDGNP